MNVLSTDMVNLKLIIMIIVTAVLENTCLLYNLGVRVTKVIQRLTVKP